MLRADGTSLHKQLFIVLRDEITRGARAPGSALPTELTLCERFGVSRATVRRALADLAAEGLVVRRHGRGTFVSDDIPLGVPAADLGLVDSFRQMAAETRVEVLSLVTELPTPQIRSLLRLQPGEHAVHIVRVRRSGRTPLLLLETWLPRLHGQALTAKGLERKALFETLIDNGVVFGRVIQEMSAEAADPFRAGALGTDVSAPLIRFSRLMYDNANQPVQYVTAHMCPDRTRIVMDISSDNVDTLSAGHIVHDPRFVAADKPASRRSSTLPKAG